jgi:hypothetical protein
LHDRQECGVGPHFCLDNKPMSLWPREHGAYGQLALPLISSFAVAGVSPAGLAIATAMIAGFAAHEPAVVLLGLRGARVNRNLRRDAQRWFGGSVAVGVFSAIAALLTMPLGGLWSLLVPTVPASLLAMATISGREKSWYGEIAGALAFSGVAVPIALAAGRPPVVGATVTVPFALLFVAGTLSVRVVILRVRGGGDPRAAARTRRAILALAATAMAVLTWAISAVALPAAVLIAAAPGLALAAAVAACPPAPTRLRSLGWMLVLASVVTAVATIVGAR